MADHAWVPAHQPDPEVTPDPGWPEHINVSTHHHPSDPHLITDAYFLDWWVSALGPTSALLLLNLNHLIDGHETRVHTLSLAARLGMQRRHGEDQEPRVSKQFVNCVYRLQRFRFLYCPTRSDWSISLSCGWLPDRYVRRLPGPLMIEHSKLRAQSSAGDRRSA